MTLVQAGWMVCFLIPSLGFALSPTVHLSVEFHRDCSACETLDKQQRAETGLTYYYASEGEFFSEPFSPLLGLDESFAYELVSAFADRFTLQQANLETWNSEGVTAARQAFPTLTFENPLVTKFFRDQLGDSTGENFLRLSKEERIGVQNKILKAFLTTAAEEGVREKYRVPDLSVAQRVYEQPNEVGTYLRFLDRFGIQWRNELMAENLIRYIKQSKLPLLVKLGVDHVVPFYDVLERTLKKNGLGDDVKIVTDTEFLTHDHALALRNYLPERKQRFRKTEAFLRTHSGLLN